MKTVALTFLTLFSFVTVISAQSNAVELVQSDELSPVVDPLVVYYGDLFSGISSGTKQSLDEEVRQSLQERLKKDKQWFDYGKARKYLFGSIHLKGNGVDGYYIEDIYCLKKFTPGNAGEVGPMMIPQHTVINTEHVWPQSRFPSGTAKEAKTDLHHLYPSDDDHNNARGNYMYGEVERPQKSKLITCDDNYLGTREKINSDPEGDLADTRLFYEPPAKSKGNIARALFYFSIMYSAPIDPVEETFLKQWTLSDPVDEEERARNEAIYEIQGNRNPFIDYPELAIVVEDF